ncbi:MAG: LuxR C-terminal-related transcriptional regulator [Cryobacterium sp.]
MTGHDTDLYRPSDRALLKGAIRQLAGQTGISVIFAGMVTRTELTITEFVGTTTRGLKDLSVQPGEGVGGRALRQARPVGVADYFDSEHITHHHDQAVRIEGLRSMVALPVLLGGQARSMLYAATRDQSSIGDGIIDELTRGAARISRELRIRDEVDHRVAILRVVQGETAAPMDRDLTEVVRMAHAELLSVASTTTDPALAERILAVSKRLLGQDPGVTDAPRLTRRETDVLSQVALGCSYAEVGQRLALKPVTVKSYMQTIMAKLHTHSRAEAVLVARRFQLLP